ncbi:DNA polymerase III subunit alpha, partial [Pseudomonadota bacterium]
MASFTHLHLHTEYSLLDGLPKIKQLVSTAKQMGMDSLAITDHGVMYGVIEFYKACLDEGIKPILGMEAYVSKKSHTIKEKKSGKYRDANHLVLLAKNFQGYQNLMKLTSIGHLEGFYYRPRFDKKTLEKHFEGLICLSACLAGEISEFLLFDEYDKAKKAASYYANIFGDNNYYLELQRHKYSDYLDSAPNDQIRSELQEQQTKEDKVNLQITKLSKDLGLPLVATNDVHYISKDQARAQDALVCVQTGKDVSDTNRMRYVDTPSFHLTSPEEMASLFQDHPEALKNTNKIAKSCDIKIKLGDWFFPKFEIPGGKTAGEHLKDLAYQGAKDKYPKITPEINKRIEYELKVIEDRGYSQYFLIVGDMANWCLSQGIVTTTRGSAAGSITLFAINITDVDPLKYKLPFERFLNPFRPSPPDIDLDIADNRRGDLIAYITKKYGADKVAQICTFGRMLARGSVRDVGRVLGFPYSFPDKISKAIPLGSQGFPMTIKKALSLSNELKDMYDNNEDAKQILDLSMQIEGNARHVSVHAAALVISPSTMTDFSPLQKESGGEKAITQYEMHAAEDVGLIKFDILGIRNLAILNSAIDIVKQTTGKTIDHKKIPLNDKKTFQMLSRGETMGTFQLGGTGMTRYLIELKPERVEDIMAMVALFRPGPMANIPEYIRRKNDPTKIKYLHPKMKSFLESSYGILVYQEDILLFG